MVSIPSIIATGDESHGNIQWQTQMDSEDHVLPSVMKYLVIHHVLYANEDVTEQNKYYQVVPRYITPRR